MRSRLVLCGLLAALAAVPMLPRTAAQPAARAAADFTRKEDVIYGRKDGLAMTMDVFTPKQNANGRGIVYCVSGGWFSAKQSIPVNLIRVLVDRGYTVFAVMHGSQPKYNIIEALGDMHRAVRYIRHHAKEYGVDPDKLGISGGSAGGHLSLMQGNAFKPGNPEARDPVERQSSKVAAVACFFPPTDFLNYGEPGRIALGGGILKNFRPPFEFTERDKVTNKLVVIEDEEKRKEIGKAISPVYFVSKESAPALIIHGDADRLVPIQQAELIVARYKEAGVPCELVVKKGAVHGWAGLDKDVVKLADWFDKYTK